MTHAGCRIARWRPKGQGLAEVVILKPGNESDREIFLAWARHLVDHHLDGCRNIRGFSVVIWSGDREHTAYASAWAGGGMSITEVPRFTAEALGSHVARRMARKVFADETGRERPDEGA